MKRHAFSLLLVLVASPLVAAPLAQPVQADPALFAAQRLEIEEAFSDGKRYSELTATRRAEILEALDRMEKTLGQVTSVSQLSPAARVQLINDQEMVNTVLTVAAEDSRLVCKRERRVGSHRVTSTCRSVAELRRAREEAERDMSQRQRGNVLPGGN